MKFTLEAADSSSKARAGILHTAHGDISTPVFLPVGTAGAVKAVHFKDLREEIGVKIMLSNTYHLYLRPGMEVIGEAGGLHAFNGWDGPILTDSGGYQVYSLAAMRKIKEEGVKFQSHIDGSSHTFTPEYVIDIQRTIGADIMMAFDECTPYPCEYDYAKNSMELTHRWLERCMNQYDTTKSKYGFDQTMFPIVQGSVYEDLRQQSAEFMIKFDADGYAIGGLSVGEPEKELYQMTELVADILPKEKPRYLMGMGTPANLLECIALGIDMFDCVVPTRNGRNGMVYTPEGIINIRNEKWKNDFSPIDETSSVYSSKHYSKAFLRHLIKSDEILGAQLATMQNLGFYLWLMKEARTKIIEGVFLTWKESVIGHYANRL